MLKLNSFTRQPPGLFFLEFQKQSLLNQEILIREQRETRAQLNRLLSSNQSSSGRDFILVEDDIYALIPLQSEENLKQAEAKLQDIATFNKVVSHFEF